MKHAGNVLRNWLPWTGKVHLQSSMYDLSCSLVWPCMSTLLGMTAVTQVMYVVGSGLRLLLIVSVVHTWIFADRLPSRSLYSQLTTRYMSVPWWLQVSAFDTNTHSGSYSTQNRSNCSCTTLSMCNIYLPALYSCKHFYLAHVLSCHIVKCSHKKLAITPPNVIDSVLQHELGFCKGIDKFIEAQVLSLFPLQTFQCKSALNKGAPLEWRHGTREEHTRYRPIKWSHSMSDGHRSAITETRSLCNSRLRHWKWHAFAHSQFVDGLTLTDHVWHVTSWSMTARSITILKKLLVTWNRAYGRGSDLKSKLTLSSLSVCCSTTV